MVNADSQQLFADLPILTARPGPAETAEIPHRLYGLLDAAEQPSLARWLALLAPVLDEVHGQRRILILVGGSGLYIHALLHGMPPMPDIPAQLRTELRTWASTVPTTELYRRLVERDPELAARLRASDTQRLLRALEVVEATGRSLLAWQAAPRQRLPLPQRVVGLALLPPAPVVNPRIESRLQAMLRDGVRGEVRDLLTVRPDAISLPIGKVHGMRELAAVLAGKMDEATAASVIAARIRGYAKRQRTWFRHQLPELATLSVVGESDAARAAATELLDD